MIGGATEILVVRQRLMTAPAAIPQQAIGGGGSHLLHLHARRLLQATAAAAAAASATSAAATAGATSEHARLFLRVVHNVPAVGWGVVSYERADVGTGNATRISSFLSVGSLPKKSESLHSREDA